jgi:hypothetical protein
VDAVRLDVIGIRLRQARSSGWIDGLAQPVTKVWLRARLRRMVTTPVAPALSMTSIPTAPSAASPQSNPLEAALGPLNVELVATGVPVSACTWLAGATPSAESIGRALAAGTRIAETTTSSANSLEMVMCDMRPPFSVGW